MILFTEFATRNSASRFSSKAKKRVAKHSNIMVACAEKRPIKENLLRRKRIRRLKPETHHYLQLRLLLVPGFMALEHERTPPDKHIFGKLEP